MDYRMSKHSNHIVRINWAISSARGRYEISGPRLNKEMDLPYDEEPHLAEKTVDVERIGNTFVNQTMSDHRRSPTPKADQGISGEEEGPSKTTQTGENNETVHPPT